MAAVAMEAMGAGVEGISSGCVSGRARVRVASRRGASLFPLWPLAVHGRTKFVSRMHVTHTHTLFTVLQKMLLAARLARQAASLRAVTTSQPSTSGRALCGAWGVSSTSTTCNLRRGAVALSSSSSSDRIDPPDVRKLAAMATIAVTDDEVRMEVEL